MFLRDLVLSKPAMLSRQQFLLGVCEHAIAFFWVHSDPVKQVSAIQATYDAFAAVREDAWD